MNGIEEYRLMYINHGLKESHKRFHECLKTKDTQNSISITASLSELLMWICISDEWHRLNNNDGGSYDNLKSDTPGGRYVKGLRYAFNSIKHVMSFIKLIGTTEHKEIFIKGYYVEDYTSEIIWLKADPLIEHDQKFENQRKNYIEYVQGKAVVKTIDEAYRFLMAEYTKVKFKSYDERNSAKEETE